MINQLDKIACTQQGTIQKMQMLPKIAKNTTLCICKVLQVFSDRNACVVQSSNGGNVYNVPLLTRAGLIDGEVYGGLDPPAIGNYVVIGFLNNRMEKPFIMGTIIPYMYPKYQSGQTPVNSGSKAYTKKLLEAGKEKYYRRIFQSGTTVEVADDGSVIVEAPDGMYIQMDATANKVIINGNLEVLK